MDIKNRIISSVSAKFKEFKIYGSKVKQGFSAPCIHIFETDRICQKLLNNKFTFKSTIEMNVFVSKNMVLSDIMQDITALLTSGAVNYKCSSIKSEIYNDSFKLICNYSWLAYLYEDDDPFMGILNDNILINNNNT